MTDSLDKVKSLIQRALHPSTPEEEARTSAMQAVRIISRDGLLRGSSPRPEPSPRPSPSPPPPPPPPPRRDPPKPRRERTVDFGDSGPDFDFSFFDEIFGQEARQAAADAKKAAQQAARDAEEFLNREREKRRRDDPFKSPEDRAKENFRQGWDRIWGKSETGNEWTRGIHVSRYRLDCCMRGAGCIIQPGQKYFATGNEGEGFCRKHTSNTGWTGAFNEFAKKYDHLCKCERQVNGYSNGVRLEVKIRSSECPIHGDQ